MSDEIDFVFPYVDCNDVIWQKKYKDIRRQMNLPTSIDSVRFRSWNNLKFLFRGIEKYMPWIRKVHMIVSNPEQVPNWIDTEKVHIVYHSDFMPKEFLPTFNSCTIEMFLRNIPDLADKFIYGNDDCFILNKLEPSDFFENDKVKISVRYDKGQETQFKKVEYRTAKFASLLAINKDIEDPNLGFAKIQHSINPMNKKTIDLIFEKKYNEIYNSCSKFRAEKNYNQYLYSYYEYFNGNVINDGAKYYYFSINSGTINDICKAIKNSCRKIICLNDTKPLNEKFFNLSKEKINDAFTCVFPQVSKYEKKKSEKLIFEFNYKDEIEKQFIINEINKIIDKLK